MNELHELQEREETVLNLKLDILDIDYDIQVKKMKDSGLIPCCKECGEQLYGFPLGARVDNPICDDCKEEIEIQESEIESELPPIGAESEIDTDDSMELIIPDD